ncbi:MAG TPA: hypothetical protein VND62_06730 [Acidimicrobiales bacterium]|nr:hypothetical protein [Acidimicrobiales bacterium]
MGTRRQGVAGLRGSATPPIRADAAPDVHPSPSSPKGLRRVLLRRRNERTIGEQALVQVRRMPVWKSILVAVATLGFVLGIALAEMVGVGAILRTINPARHVDIYHALHNQLVVGSLIGMSLLWLLPPHPWAQRLVEATHREEPAQTAGAAGEGDRKVASLSVYPRGDMPPRRDEAQGVGG